MDDIPAVWPGTKEEVDMLTLGVTTEYTSRSQARKKFFDDSTTICTANFRTNPNYPFYHTSTSPSEDLAPDWRGLLPDPDTHIVLFFDGCLQLSFTGRTIPLGFVPEGSVFRAAVFSRQLFVCKPEENYKVRKVFGEDRSVCNWQIATLRSSCAQVRKAGFHVANVLYGACVPPGFDTTAAASGITAQQESEHMNCLAGLSLCPKQTALCRSAFSSNTGMTLTLGPGHGGKGALLSTAATIVGMLQLGKKVLVCGPTNRSIKAIVEKFLEPLVKVKVKALIFNHWAIYTGGYAKKGLKSPFNKSPGKPLANAETALSPYEKTALAALTQQSIDFRITNVYDAEALATRSVVAATASLEFPPGDMEHLRDNGQEYDDLLA